LLGSFQEQLEQHGRLLVGEYLDQVGRNTGRFWLLAEIPVPKFGVDRGTTNYEHNRHKNTFFFISKSMEKKELWYNLILDNV
jgi:hypothetical protein